MKLPIMTGTKNVGERELPRQFYEEYRPDLIQRAVLALQSAGRQQYGSSPLAGLRHSSTLSKRRRNYRGSYGFGISRVDRKIHSRRGTRMYWVGTFSPQTVGGRRAHPPKAAKNLREKINKKENRKAIRSAIAATVSKDLVIARGHHIPATYPFIIATALEGLSKTKEIINVLSSLGLAGEMERSSAKKVRRGRGTTRGRRYRRKKGMLIVVGGPCSLQQAARNIPGIDIVDVKALNAELLAPGAMPGRATLWTEHALDVLQKESLFS